MPVTITAPILIGIMSGTSADGIDVAIVSSGKQTKLIQFSEFSMPATLRESILALAKPGMGEIDRMGETDRTLGKAYAEAALATIEQAGLQPTDIAAIGCHGQTIRHRPEMPHPFSLQIGCAATLAEITGITTVSDFRSRDIAADGEGAPLVPFAHRQLFNSTQYNTAIVNIGGIANVTWLGSDGYTTGFDIGPGNMLMDALMLAISDGHQTYDQDGETAAAGSVCEDLLAQLMQQPFLSRTPPKSTGREMFGKQALQPIMDWPNISHADRLATACCFTADAIVNSIAFMPEAPMQWLICGGGVRNTHLMRLLEKKLAPAAVQTTDATGIPAQAVEAISFALLARHTLVGSPNTLSAVTGATHDVCGGHITPANNWSDLLKSIPVWNL